MTPTVCTHPEPCSYLVMPFMGTDLGKLMKHEKLSEDRIQFLVYQMLKGLKVGTSVYVGGGAGCRNRQRPPAWAGALRSQQADLC